MIKLITSKNTNYILLFILGVATLINATYLYQLKETPFFTNLLSDEEVYHNKALNIMQEGWVGNSIYYQAPLYPYFLAIIYKLFGVKIVVIRFIQGFISVFNVLVSYFIGKHLFNNKVGLLCSAITALCGILVFYGGLLLKVPLSVLFTSLLLLSLLRANKYQTLISYCIAGICFGINITLRGNYYLLLPGIMVCIIICSPTIRLKFGNLLIFIIGITAIILPITIRNYYVEKDFVLTSYQGGANFYIGNNSLSKGDYTNLGFVRALPEFEEKDFRARAEEMVGRHLKPSEISHFWFSQSFQLIKESPLFYLKLFVRKNFLFFNNYEIPDNYDYYLVKSLTPILNVSFISFGLLLTLSSLGIFFIKKQSSDFLIFYVFIISYALSIVIFYVVSRYRTPIIPALIPFAAYFLVEGWKNISKLKGLNLVVFAGIFFFSLYVGFKSNYIADSPSPHYYYILGDLYTVNGSLEKAIGAYRKSLEIKPDYAYTHYNLGNVYFKKGLIDEAVSEYKTTLKIKPDSIFAHYNLGDIYTKKGLISKAIAEYQKALKTQTDQADYHNLTDENAYYSRNKLLNKAIVDYLKAMNPWGKELMTKDLKHKAAINFQRTVKITPDYIDANRLGLFYAKRGLNDKAIAEYYKALRLRPNYYKAHNNLGNVYFKLNRYSKAMEEYNIALNLKPDNPDIHYNLGHLYYKLGRVQEAIQEWYATLSIAPNHEAAKKRLEIVK